MTTEPRASLVEVELADVLEALVADVKNGWGDPHTLRHAEDVLARHRLEALRTQGDGEGGGWASPSLGRAYREVEKLRERLAQPPESGIDESLRRALDAIETADTEIIGVAS